MSSIGHVTETVPADELESAEPPEDASVGRDGIRLILRFIRVQPMSFALSLVGGITWSALVVAITYVLGRVTDEVITPAFAAPAGALAGSGGLQGSGTGAPAGADAVAGTAARLVSGGTVAWAMFAVVIVAVLRGASVVMRRWFGSVTETINQAELRRAVSHRLLVMPLSSYRRHQTGQLLANADVDITNGTRLLMPLPFSLGVIALAIFALISLLLADVYFALVALVLFPLLAALSRYYTNKVTGPAARVQEKLGVVSSIAHESFDGALTVKTLGRQAAENERFRVAAGGVRSERLVVASMTSFFEPMIQVLPNLGMIILLLVGAWRVDGGATTPGQLVQAIALFGWLVFPMRIVGFMFESLPTSVVSVRRVDRVLAEPISPAAEGSGLAVAAAASPAAPDSAAPVPARSVTAALDSAAAAPALTAPDSTPPAPDLVVDNVSFGYEADSTTGTGGVTVLDGVTFDVEAGEVVALVGPTGSGKTTLINLLVRLDEPDSGVISIGGVPIDALDPDDLRRIVSVAFQESFLFADSIRSNISMGRTVTSEDLLEVLERSGAARFVPKLPDGVDTEVGERGVTLSGGQRQRVALARALARQPQILLLDDATSAVDPVIEAGILARLRDGRTSMLIVAHRLSTIMLADRVVHLVNGRVRAEGTHDELLADPEYAALVHAYEVPEDLAAEAD